MSAERDEILTLIADLAAATSEWRCGSSGGVAYSNHVWRASVLQIAERAAKLKDKAAREDV